MSEIKSNHHELDKLVVPFDFPHSKTRSPEMQNLLDKVNAASLATIENIRVGIHKDIESWRLIPLKWFPEPSWSDIAKKRSAATTERLAAMSASIQKVMAE